MVDVEVETALSHNMIVYIVSWKLENTTQIGRSQFLGTLAWGCWLSALSKASACLAALWVGPLLSDVIRSGIPFRYCVLQGLSCFLLLFPIYTDQWPEDKEQACIIIINAEGCVKPWRICCFTPLHPPKNLPSQSSAKGQQSALAQINPFGFPIALEKYI